MADNKENMCIMYLSLSREVVSKYLMLVILILKNEHATKLIEEFSKQLTKCSLSGEQAHTYQRALGSM